jgi:hypothetical protein
MKPKLGGYVKIIADTSGHNIPIGTIGRVRRREGDLYLVSAKGTQGRVATENELRYVRKKR